MAIIDNYNLILITIITQTNKYLMKVMSKVKVCFL